MLCALAAGASRIGWLMDNPPEVVPEATALD